jgi:hypothetical protein
MPAARFAWLRRNLKFRYGILGYRGETGISRQTGDVHFGRSDTFKSFLEKSRVLHAAAFLPQLWKKSRFLSVMKCLPESSSMKAHFQEFALYQEPDRIAFRISEWGWMFQLERRGEFGKV